MNLSQVLDTGIGTLLFLVLFSATASALLEFGQTIWRSREKDLSKAIQAMVGTANFAGFCDSPPIQAAARAAGGGGVVDKAGESQRQLGLRSLTAATFADGVLSGVTSGSTTTSPELSGALRMILGVPSAAAAIDLDKARVGLEAWFERTMADLSQQYRTASFRKLAITGYLAAIACKASVADVILSLWNSATLRQVAVEAAAKLPAPNAQPSAGAGDVQTVVDQVDKVAQLGFPIGWDQAPWAAPFSWSGFLWYAVWFALTGVLVGMGGQYWFELMAKLLSVRTRLVAITSGTRESDVRIVGSSGLTSVGSLLQLSLVNPVPASPDQGLQDALFQLLPEAPAQPSAAPSS